MSMSDLNVIVIAGGLSPEREVSLRSGSRVADALRRAGGVEVEVISAEYLGLVGQPFEAPVDAGQGQFLAADLPLAQVSRAVEALRALLSRLQLGPGDE